MLCINGLGSFFINAAIFGIIVILEPLYNQKIFVKDIKQYKPNMLIGATSLWHYAARNPELKKLTYLS